MLLKRRNHSPLDIHISCSLSKSERLVKMSSDSKEVYHFVPSEDIGGEFFRKKRHSLHEIMADLDNMVELDTGLLPEHVLA